MTSTAAHNLEAGAVILLSLLLWSGLLVFLADRLADRPTITETEGDPQL